VRFRNSALLFGAIAVQAIGSTVSVVDVPLRDVVAKSQLIVLAKVEEIGSEPFANAADDEPEIRLYQLRVEEVLKSKMATSASAKGGTIQAFDPRDLFQHEHYKLIRAGVMSFAEQRYATKAANVAEGDHLIFFLNEQPPLPAFPVEHAYVFAVGQAYDVLAQKAAVLQLLR
jgi:hypothetical protein